MSAGWVATNPLTPNGAATYTYGSGLLSSTDTSGTAHYTRTPAGTLVSQRVPGATSNYYYLFDGPGSVIKLVDASGTVQATYAYCPTGNDADPSFGLAAPGNPYRYLGRYYDPATKMFYDAYGYTDSNSDNGTQLCLVRIGGLSLFCLPQLPSTTRLPAPPCPGGPQFFGPKKYNGFVVNARGPQGGYDCHVNVEAQGYPPNLHIRYVGSPNFTGGEYIANQDIFLGYTAAEAAAVSVDIIEGIVGSTGGALYWDLAGRLISALEQLAFLTP